jgi:Cys-rich protein (TIGR01571 family)
MQRMQLTWLGEPGPISSTRNSFKVVVTVVIIYCLYSTSLGMPFLPQNPLAAFWSPHLRFWGYLVFGAWFIYSLCRTRENVRTRYSIEEEHCLGCEDCCCALLCSCCTVAQLARHTGDYETYPSVCCSETGHPPGSPLTV